MSVHPSLRTAPGRRRTALLGGAVATLLAGSLLSSQGAVAEATPTPTAPPGSAPQGTPRPRRRTATRRLPTKKRVADLLGRMTLAEKVGQMTQAERQDVDADPSLVTTYGLGSVLSGGGSTPSREHARGVGRHGRHLPGAPRWRPGSASR